LVILQLRALEFAGNSLAWSSYRTRFLVCGYDRLP
jgi:hypothetical protein